MNATLAASDADLTTGVVASEAEFSIWYSCPGIHEVVDGEDNVIPVTATLLMLSYQQSIN